MMAKPSYITKYIARWCVCKNEEVRTYENEGQKRTHVEQEVHEQCTWYER